jgi:hypothetical protein
MTSDFSEDNIASIFRVKSKPSKNPTEAGGMLMKVIATSNPANQKLDDSRGI